MDEQVDRATKDKRITLFKKLLEEYGYPGVGVVDELQFGSDLTGEVPATNMLPYKFAPSLLSTEALPVQSSLRSSRIMHRSCSSDAEIDKEVYRLTLEECDKGWLEGPIDECDVPSSAPVSERFGLTITRSPVYKRHQCCIQSI